MKNILLVEPDKQTAKLLEAGLKIDGTQIFHASDSQQAILIADKNLPDIVVLELGIPDQNGVAFLHEFRSYVEWVDVPVIVHTNLLIDTDAVSTIKKNLKVKNVFYKPDTTIKSLRLSVLDGLGL